ncbi:3-methyladenine DNA glycosylase AlkD [Rhizobium sp. BE258]|jgi:3-methyladenine DNA glycosylase AlkD|nr:3-methyladenine DNA glycosylase AlkD [Rhizobium sp. BE258]
MIGLSSSAAELITLRRTCHAQALKLARRLADGSGKTARWSGKDAMRELTSDAISPA